jgi:hypothetical protein
MRILSSCPYTISTYLGRLVLAARDEIAPIGGHLNIGDNFAVCVLVQSHFLSTLRVIESELAGFVTSYNVLIAVCEDDHSGF